MPVVTAEEAEKLNEDAKAYALAEKEKREPFYKYYQDIKLDSVCFQGTIRATSIIPDPEKNDYDNCLYALFVDIDALLSDVTTDTEIPCEVIVNVPIMKNKSILQDNRFLPGDKIWCTCSKYDKMPQGIQEIQLSDDIQSYEHQQYFSIAINKISSFQKEGNRNFAKREITILPIQTLPKDEKAVALRKERIQSEIARIEGDLKKHGGSFEAWKEEYKPIAKKYEEMCQGKFKTWINNSFFAAGMPETDYSYKSLLSGILPYKKYLEKNNIDLVVLRIPTKGDFAARVLTADNFQDNPKWVECYYELLKNDIEIIDPMPEMWKHRFDYPLFYFYHIDEESHPLEGTVFTASEVLADILKRYSYEQNNSAITVQTVSYKYKGNDSRYFWPSGNNNFNDREHISFRGTIQDNKPVDTSLDSGSPFLFTSNSFFVYPSRPLGATVPSYTAYFLQSIPDWLYQAGVKIGPMCKNLLSNSDILSQRKVVVVDMIGGPTAGDVFPPIPRYILEGASKLSLEQRINALTDEQICNLELGTNVLISKNEYNETSIKSNTNAGSSFNFSMNIAPIPEKKVCMLRLNFTKSIVGSFSVRDSENTSIDFGSIGTGQDMFVDLFISTESNDKFITVKCTFYQPYEVILRNIELWYY